MNDRTVTYYILFIPFILNGCAYIDKTDVDEAEIVVDELPDRTADNSHEAIEEQFTAMDRELRKKEHYLKKRREQYSWSRRAELVGVAPLPPRRPKKSERLDWEMKIISKEEEYK